MHSFSSVCVHQARKEHPGVQHIFQTSLHAASLSLNPLHVKVWKILRKRFLSLHELLLSMQRGHFPTRAVIPIVATQHFLQSVLHLRHANKAIVMTRNRLHRANTIGPHSLRGSQIQ